MKKLKDIISERLHINKDSKFSQDIISIKYPENLDSKLMYEKYSTDWIKTFKNDIKDNKLYFSVLKGETLRPGTKEVNTDINLFYIWNNSSHLQNISLRNKDKIIKNIINDNIIQGKIDTCGGYFLKYDRYINILILIANDNLEYLLCVLNPDKKDLETISNRLIKNGWKLYSGDVNNVYNCLDLD